MNDVIPQFNPATGMVEIYWRSSGLNNDLSYASELTEEGHVVWQMTENGKPIKPFMILRPDQAENLARGLSKIPMADDSTVRHLQDTMDVRDRLLKLVEISIERGTPTPVVVQVPNE